MSLLPPLKRLCRVVSCSACQVNVASSVAVMKTLQSLQQRSVVAMGADHGSSRSQASTLRIENGDGNESGSNGSSVGGGSPLKLVLDSSHNCQFVIPELRAA